MHALQPSFELFEGQPAGLVVRAEIRRRRAPLGIADENVVILGHSGIVCGTNAHLEVDADDLRQ